MSELLRPYIPLDRYLALAGGRALPDRAVGAALFADISGFTPLTAALARAYGPDRGAEEMTTSMSAIYEALVAETQRYGGSVISFCGDALICWFDGDDDLRAAACGLAMQAAIVPHATISVPSGATYQVAIKVLIGRGPVRRFLPGDPALRLVDVLAGSAVELAGLANGCASAGEVLLDEAAALALGPAVAVAAWRVEASTGRRFAVLAGLSAPPPHSPWPVPVAPVAESIARAWLWPTIYERLAYGSERLLGELRPATALFLAFEGIDYDGDDEAGSKLDALISYVQAVIARYEGTFVELTIGDKGSYLYAAFGVPLAHDDDAARAIAAGMQLCALPAQLGFISGARVGIAHGLCYTGIYGGIARRTYGVQGEQVNLAARLMQHAEPWTVCCDDTARRRAGPGWRFEELPPARVKGKDEPVAIFRPVGHGDEHAPRPAERSPLVGRDAEVARLRAALDALAAGARQVLFIEGEAGIGKSRLAQELLRMAEGRGVMVLQGAGQSIEQHTPYRIWRDLLGAFFGLEEQGDSEVRLARVRGGLTRLAATAKARLPLLNDILHLGAPDTPATAAMDAPLRQENLMRLVAELLSGREGPRLLVLEDAQWLDSLSWRLAAHVALAAEAASEPLLLVVVTRPLDELEPAARWAAPLRGRAAPALALGAIDPAATIALAASRVGLAPDGLPAAVADLVRRRAGGNPFFAEELVLALRDQGQIGVVAGRCAVTGDLAAAEQALPTTLYGLVLSRIDRLPPDRQLVLKIAAVIGRTFAYTPLRATITAYAATADDLLQAQLDDLTRRNMTVLESLEPELTYLFKHIVTRDVAYQTLLFAQRKQIHRLVAAWYEQTFGGATLASSYALLAHHYQHAEEPERERVYARLAGEQAAAQYANPEALGYLTRALELTAAEAATSRYEVLLVREKVYDLLGEREAQRADLEALTALAELAGDKARQAEVALRRAIFAEMLGDSVEATRQVEQSISQARAAGHPAAEAAGYHWWGIMLWAQGQIAAREKLERALALARANTLVGIEAQSLAALGNLAWLEANPRAATSRYHEALPLYRAVGDRRGESTTINNLGLILQSQSDYAGARAAYEQALHLKRELGDRRGEAKTLVCLGSLFSTLGAFELARGYFEQALARYRAIGGLAGELEAQSFLAELLYNDGDLAGALHCGEEALRLAELTGSRDDLGRVLLPLGDILAALGENERAAAVYGDALAIWRDLELPHMMLSPRAGLARLALAAGNPQAALASAEALLAQILSAETTEGYFVLAQTCYEVLRAAGDPRAGELLREAVAALEARAALIEDPELRRSFLERIPAHRALRAAAPPPDGQERAV